MAYDLALAERIRSAVAGKPDVTEKEMFGGVAFLYRGKMFVGVMKPGFGTIVRGGLMARVGPEAGGAALKEPHTTPFEMRGRAMAGYVIVDPDGAKSARAVAAWVGRAWAFAQTLPAKGAEKARPRKSAAARPRGSGSRSRTRPR